MSLVAPSSYLYGRKVQVKSRWLTIFFLLGFVVGLVTATDNAKQSGGSGESERNLYELTDAELEAICTSRGFELVREIDNATGEPISYTHDDYVDAAKECLELEEEMESFFEDNPDLLGDLQAETEAMMKEKEELEQRLAEAQEKLVKEKTKQAEKVKRDSLVAAENSDKGGSNEYLSSLPYGDETGMESEPLADASGSIDDDQREKEENSGDRNGNDDEKEEKTDTDINDSSPDADGSGTPEGRLESEATESRSNLSSSSERKATSESAVDASPGSKDEGPLAFSRFTKETLMEFGEKVQKDLARVGDIIVPEPLREPLKEMMGVTIRVAKSAGISMANMTKRYFLAILDSVKEVRAADAENEGDDQPGALKRYLSALVNAVKRARAEAKNNEENHENANVK